MSPDFWRDKRVFLTGHTGFKGSWLALWLSKMGANVTGYALSPPTEPSLFELARASEGIESIIADIRDFKTLELALRRSNPDIVLHLAAQPLVRASYERPLETYSTNVMGTANLLEAVRGAGGHRAVVIVTTDKCYRNQEWVWPYREEDELGGHDPYSSSKASAELITESYRKSFFCHASRDSNIHVASARAGNVIGGGDWAPDRLIPDLVTSFLSGETVNIRNPLAVRPWQHVLEPLRGYLMLAERLFLDGETYAESWNFGPEGKDNVAVGSVVKIAAELWGDGATWRLEPDMGQHPHEAGLLRLDINKADCRLGWRPALKLDRALEWTVEWYKYQAAGENIRDMTLRQLDEYQRLIGQIR